VATGIEVDRAPLQLFSYRRGQAVLEDIGLLEEVTTVADNVSPSLLAAPGRHAIISRAFEAEDWSVESQVRGFRVDGYKRGVGLEIELSHVVHVYHDLFKFMISFSHGRLEAGVLLVLADDAPAKGLIRNHSSLPTLTRTKSILRRLEQHVPVPLLLVAVP
jgi:hypothetical protein